MSPYFLHLLHSMRRTLCLTLMSAVFSTAARPPLPLDLRPSGGTRKIRSASTSSFAAMQTGRCGCHLLSLGAHCAQEALGAGWVGTGLRLRSRRECVDDALSFSGWLHRVDHYVATTSQRRVLFLCDNASCHGSIEDIPQLSHITIKFLPKRSTSILRPLDLSFMACIKRKYQRRQSEHVWTLLKKA